MDSEQSEIRLEKTGLGFQDEEAAWSQAKTEA